MLAPSEDSFIRRISLASRRFDCSCCGFCPSGSAWCCHKPGDLVECGLDTARDGDVLFGSALTSSVVAGEVRWKMVRRCQEQACDGSCLWSHLGGGGKIATNARAVF
mmetsp:Transcript_19702/g.49921  ORF Transcript_19702/g.49921 Transcript_19702/m.49921 type:complete len:107 (+) Transcript_19702:540-860(+)